MASNTSQTVESLLTDSDADHDLQAPHNQKRRRMSWRTQLPASTDLNDTPTDPHAALLQGHDHEGAGSRSRQMAETMDAYQMIEPKDTGFLKQNASKQGQKIVASYLAQHIPKQYNPLGGNSQQNGNRDANTKYCYRHRPDMLCRRQADEPTMDELQEEVNGLSQVDSEAVSHVWTLFSAAPSAQRNLMLKGILAQCCFPQLSFISSSVRSLIKIDFLAALPPELGFQILCKLDTASLCKAAQVSQRWRTLANDDVVWHKMCEQHVDRKCTKCGWGLPLLERKRLRNEKREIQLRATGRGVNEWSPDITPTPESSENAHVSVGSKRPASDEEFVESSTKRTCITRPWKEVYKERWLVSTNWKHGKYSTKTFKGHTNGIMCLQFDASVLMTGSYDCTVKIWDIESGQELRTLTGHTQGIRSLQFDENKVFTGSLDGTIKIWNRHTGQCKNTITGHSKGILWVSYNKELGLLASGSQDNTCNVYDYNTGKRTRLTGHMDWVNCVKFDAESRTLFSASDDCTIKVWDLDTFKCIRTIEGHAGQVQQVHLLPPEFEFDEAELAQDSNNDHSDAASMASQESPPDGSSSDQDESGPFFPNNPDRPSPPQYMLTCSLDGTTRLWHLPTGRCLHRFFGHVEGVWAIAADTLRMVSGAEDKTVKIWDPRTGLHERTLTGHTAPVTCIGLSDSRLASGSEDCQARMYSFETEDVQPSVEIS